MTDPNDFSFSYNGFAIGPAAQSYSARLFMSSVSTTFYVNDATNNSTVTYGLNISGTGTFTKLGTGTLILTGGNTYTGTTTILDGTLSIGNGVSSGTITSSIVNNSIINVYLPQIYFK
jgi:autotransporter-associated beta strand protein